MSSQRLACTVDPAQIRTCFEGGDLALKLPKRESAANEDAAVHSVGDLEMSAPNINVETLSCEDFDEDDWKL